ncbi:MAG: hypothetical protein ACK5IQ_03430 [Bacteroidales bacterium]
MKIYLLFLLAGTMLLANTDGGENIYIERTFQKYNTDAEEWSHDKISAWFGLPDFFDGVVDLVPQYRVSVPWGVFASDAIKYIDRIPSLVVEKDYTNKNFSGMARKEYSYIMDGNDRVTHMEYKDDKEHTVLDCIYDVGGKVKNVNVMTKKGEVDRDQKIQLEYDGNLITKIVEHDKLVGERTISIEYQKGNITKITKVGKIDRTAEGFTYDKNGRLDYVVSYWSSKLGDRTAPIMRYEYDYDKKGRVDAIMTKKYKNNKSVVKLPHIERKVEYDSQGRWFRQVVTRWNETTFKMDRIRSYTRKFNPDGKLEYCNMLNLEDADKKLEYVYNSEGKVKIAKEITTVGEKQEVIKYDNLFSDGVLVNQVVVKEKGIELGAVDTLYVRDYYYQ